MTIVRRADKRSYLDGFRMASSVAGSVTTVLACRSRPTRRRLSLLPLLLAVVLLSDLALLLPGVHGARPLDDGEETKVAEASDQMMTTHAAAARWSVTVREGGGGGHGSGHAGAGHGHGGGSGTGGHGSGHGRPEPANHHPGRRGAAPGAGQPSMAASCAALLAAVALLRL